MTDNLEPTYIANAQKAEDERLLAEARARRAARQKETPTEDVSREAPKPEKKSIADTVGEVASDVVGGIVEVPGAVLHGAIDGLNETTDFIDEAGDSLGRLMGFNPTIVYRDEETGKLSAPRIIVSQAERDRLKARFEELGIDDSGNIFDVPQVAPEQDTGTGKVIESIAQFAAGFAGAKKLAPLAKTGPIARAAIQGAIADFAVFDGQEGRLSDVIAQVPGLGQYVPEFMQTNEDDSEIVSRMKTAAEGAIVGPAFDTLISGMRAMRKTARAKAALVEVDTKVGSIEDAIQQKAAQTDGEIEEVFGKKSEGRYKALPGDKPGDPEKFAPNLARINSSDDIKKTIAEMVQKHSTEVDKARRGVVSHATTEAEAAQVNAWERLMSRRPGETLTAGESVAARELWATSAKALRDASHNFLASPTAGTRFAFTRAMSVHRAIQAEVMGARAEAGRILESWKIPAGDKVQRLKEIEDTLAMYGGSEGDMAKIAKRVATLGDDQIGVLDDVVSKALNKTSDVFGEVWRFSLLSSPKTHLVNAISNTAVIAYDIAETALAGRIGRLMGNTENAELIEEAATKWGAVRSAVESQFKYFAENKRFNNMGVVVGKVDAPRRAVSAAGFGFAENSALGKFTDFMGRVLTIPQDALGGADDFFKGVNFHAEMAAQAHRIATQEVRVGQLSRDDISKRVAEIMDSPSPELWEAAREAAQTRTFTKPPKPGGAVAGVMSARRWMNSGGLPIGHILLPFINTPANIMKFTFDRTPFGYRLLRDELAKGGKTAALAEAKIAMGTSILFLGADYAMNGQVTGGGPSDPNARKTLERTGWQPYSVKIGDTWVRFDRFDPLGSILGMGADFHEILSNRAWNDPTDEDIMSLAGQMTGAVGNAMISKTYLTGVSDFLALLNEPDRYGPNYLDRIASSFLVPAGVAEIRRQVDPMMRETATATDAIKNRLPGASKDLAPRVDLWGRPGVYQSHLGMAYDAMSPFIAKKVDPEPIDSELLRLRYFPAMPDRSISIPFQGRRIDVSLKSRPDIYSRMVALAGNEAKIFPGQRGAKEFLNETIESAQYQRLQDGSEAVPGSKSYMIRRTISAARKAATAMTYQEFRHDLEQMARRQFEFDEAERTRQEQEAAQAALEEIVAAQ